MLKSKSLEDFNSVVSEQLFTELTPKQGSAIEGGNSVLWIKSLQGLRLTSGPGSDEVYVKVNGRKIADNDDMDTGELWNIDYTKIITDPVTISIYEQDGLSRDDFIGAVTVSTKPGSLKVKDFFGDGSHYRLLYGVGTLKT